MKIGWGAWETFQLTEFDQKPVKLLLQQGGDSSDDDGKKKHFTYYQKRNQKHYLLSVEGNHKGV